MNGFIVVRGAGHTGRSNLPFYYHNTPLYYPFHKDQYMINDINDEV